ncbi:MAG: type II toxin-antitoxin system YafQ family toxin [Kiritimatiellaeota bacterium]|nr:type II toxin-antitoxin system YafQ family toxin [Kiritimatiellota bacterium]
MIYDIERTSRYKRDYKLMEKRGANMALLHEVIDLLRQGKPLPMKHCDHALKGKFIGSRECHIMPDWLLIYQIERDILVLTLMRTGTHSEIFVKEESVAYCE